MKLENDLFYCESLLANKDNLQLIQTFHVEKETGLGLEHYLKNAAVSDELTHQARTYLVKDKDDGSLAGYFSLKAGTVATKVRKTFFRLEMDSIPATELANFAVNDNYRTSHKNLHGLGKIIFFYFVLPTCKYAAEYIGINTLYIFALPYNELIKYYKELHFHRLPKIMENVIHRYHKPRYDEGCIFMSRPLHAEGR